MKGKYLNNNYMIEYRQKNKEKISTYNKKYKEENKEKLKEYNRIYANKYFKERKQNDILFRLTISIRSGIINSIKRNKFSKKSSTLDILGCSFIEFKQHLESKFEPWMTWENRGLYNGEFNFGWDIDHIIPTSSSTTEDEVLKLNHYTNLQPLCSKVNRDIKIDNIL